MRYSEYWPICAKRLDTMRVLDNQKAAMERYARFALDPKNREVYAQIEEATRVPWYWSAAVHRRESDSDFNTYMGNGQPLSRVTTIVPKGRGPFTGPNAFINGAIDAYKIDGLTKVIPPWPVEKLCYWAEVFNGAGYWNKGLPSPYIWAGSTVQVRGKYVDDGRFDPNAWDTQPGVASILWMIGYLDPSIQYTRET